MADFNAAVFYVLKNEGGFSNDKEDHATNHGITIETLSRWRLRPVSVQEVKDLGEAEAIEIFHRWWWTPMGLIALNGQGVATSLMDIGVNQGPGTSIKIAQRALNKLGCKIDVDGHLGQHTEDSLNLIDSGEFLGKFVELVIQHYNQIVLENPKKTKYLHGWAVRAAELLSLK